MGLRFFLDVGLQVLVILVLLLAAVVTRYKVCARHTLYLATHTHK